MRISDWSSDVCSSDLQREQHRLAGAGRPDDQHMTDIADMTSEAERGRAFGLAVKHGGWTEMLVPFRPRPHRRQGNEVGAIEGGHRRLAAIGVDMARQTPGPGFGRGHALDPSHEGEAVLEGNGESDHVEL